MKNRWVRFKAWSARTWLRFKAWVMAALVAVGLVTAPMLMANDVNLSWTNATEWEDGATLLAGDLVYTFIDYEMFALGSDIASLPRSYSELVRLPATDTTYFHGNVGNGIHCYIAYHVAINGERSLYSNESCKTIDGRAPTNPTDMQAN